MLYSCYIYFLYNITFSKGMICLYLLQTFILYELSIHRIFITIVEYA